jgi:hypothetical protein
MSDMLVELLSTKTRATNGHAQTFKVQSKPSTFEVTLEKAMKLSRPRAHEVWRALQLLVNNESLVGQSDEVVLLAMEFNPFPVTWRVIADKALEHEHFGKDR